MRILISSDETIPASTEVDDETLARLYAADPATSRVGDGVWLRVNMVSTVDGSAQGDDGLSGGINNAADKRVYDALRATADVIVVGAGTARDEGYGPADVPLVVVSRSGRVPEKLRGHAPGRVRLATVEKAEHIDEARALLGDDHVWTLGGYAINRGALRERLAKEGFAQVLAEGGPHLFRDMLNADVVDELCLTVVPRLVAGDHSRITAGGGIDVALSPTLLLEEDGTLLGRWLTVG